MIGQPDNEMESIHKNSVFDCLLRSYLFQFPILTYSTGVDAPRSMITFILFLVSVASTIGNELLGRPIRCISSSLFMADVYSMVASPLLLTASPIHFAVSKGLLSSPLEQVSLIQHAWNLILSACDFEALYVLELKLEDINRRRNQSARGSDITLLLYWIASLVLTLLFRFLYGFVFSRATGWAVPALFFSDAAHECSFGIFPFGVCLILAFQSRHETVLRLHFDFPFVSLMAPLDESETLELLELSNTDTDKPNEIQVQMMPKDSSTDNFTDNSSHIVTIHTSSSLDSTYDSPTKSTIHSSTLLNIIVVIRLLSRKLVWWIVSGISAGLVIYLVSTFLIACQSFIFKKKLYLPVQENVRDTLATDEEVHPKQIYSEPRFFKVISFAFVVLVIVFSQEAVYYLTRTTTLAVPGFETEWRTIHSPPATIAFLVMTAPRRYNADHLSETLISILTPLNDTVRLGGAQSPVFSTHVYTEFKDHPAFDSAQQYFNTTVEFHRNSPSSDPYKHDSQQRQSLQFANALEWILAKHVQTLSHVILMEDDFPFCYADKGFEKMLFLLLQTVKRVPYHCGIFVGTGGSGHIIEKTMVQPLIEVLRTFNDRSPADLLIIDCLSGLHMDSFSATEEPYSGCLRCKNALVVSERLLMRHTGSKASTFGNRTYSDEKWQCDWRQPLNGQSDTLVFI